MMTLKFRLWYCLLAAAALAFSAFAADNAARSVELTGTFSRKGNANKKYDLKAVYTPDGTNAWKAVYEFDWKDKREVYRGAVKGHLDNGEVSGDAAPAGAKRTFALKGVAKNGVLTFDHVETTKGAPQPTGVGTLTVMK